MLETRYQPSSQNKKISRYARDQCADLERQQRVVFDQMASLLRQEKPQDQGKGDDPLDRMIEDWAQAEVDQLSGAKATTPLQKLLKQHHDLGEDILDVVAENLLVR